MTVVVVVRAVVVVRWMLVVIGVTVVVPSTWCILDAATKRNLGKRTWIALVDVMVWEGSVTITVLVTGVGVRMSKHWQRLLIPGVP